MEGIYDIRCDGQTVGTAKVSAEGLYYRFDCLCRPDKKEIFKIFVDCDGDCILLGTPIPEGDAFRLQKRLPRKRFTGESMGFFIEENVAKKSAEFVPVKENEPFLHLIDLDNAVFGVQDGNPGVFLRK